MTDDESIDPNRYRTIWISDVHLATRGCKADFLLDFLKHNESQYLYLVGDIIDGWRMKRAFYWTQSHNDVIQKLLRKARKGTRVFYIPGNHDEAMRGYLDLEFGGVEVVGEVAHVAADGRRYLVAHGDEYDGVILYSKWLAHLGSRAYETMLTLNHYFNLARRKLGYPYWSLSAFLKHKVKNAVEFIARFQSCMLNEARRRRLDGVICGHIHRADLVEVDGLVYGNPGDWVESCTALVEHWDGKMEVVHWAQIRELSFFEASR